MKVTLGFEKMNIEALARACGAKTVGDAHIEFDSVCTDSREANSGTLFVAIRGERTDGHRYIKDVIEAGCTSVLCEYIPDGLEKCGSAFAVVPDSIAALSAIGKYYKDLMNHKTVAITGSVGKTTTKEFVSSVLAQKHKVYKTDGNYNSVIGMPLCMLELDPTVEYAVLEMGMSGFGEIESMSLSAEPDIALITNIGTSHLEYLGTRENICRAKCEIVKGIRKEGVLIVNGDEPLLLAADSLHKNVVRVGIDSEEVDFRAVNIRNTSDGTFFDIELKNETVKDIKISVIGKHNVYAALFAFAVGVSSGMSAEDIKLGLMRFATVGMRQNIYEHGGVTVIEDCYNASPESMRAASEVLSQLATEKRGRAIAVLGDMRELGEESDSLHFGVGECFIRAGVDLLYTFGESAEKIADGAHASGLTEDCIHRNKNLDSPETSGKAILASCRDGDVILFKASRSVAAERIIEYLKKNLTT